MNAAQLEPRGRLGAALEARDIDNCFTLFMGRVADGAAREAIVGLELPAALRELLESDEFRTRVLTPLLLRESLPHERLGAAPSFSLLDWVQARLPLEPATRCMAGAARSWVQLLELLLADAQFLACAATLVQAEIDVLLRERLATQPLWKTRRRVVGAIDSASAVEIRGWALDLCNKHEPVVVEFFADNLFVGAVTCGDSRPDVQEACGGDGLSGFCFRVPPTRRGCFEGGRTLIAVDPVSREQIGASTYVDADLTAGLDILATTRREVAQLREILQRIEERLPDLERIASVPLEAYGSYWERFYRPPPDRTAEQRRRAATFSWQPLIALVLPAWNSNGRYLARAIDSVRAQSYERWELVISDDGSTDSDDFEALMRRYASDARIRWTRAAEHRGIAASTNSGAAHTSGDYLGFIDHDDELAPEALFEVCAALNRKPYALIYTDHDRIEEEFGGRLVHHSPFFKPDFDPELLRSMNYMCHFVLVRRDLWETLGGLRPQFDSVQDHDLLLRVTEKLPADEILHLPKVLYHWRVTANSVSQSPERIEDIKTLMINCVQEHLDRTGCAARAEAHADPIGTARLYASRVRWSFGEHSPQVSIIIPTRDRVDLLRPCIDSILRSAPAYAGEIDLIVMDNDSVETATHEYLQALAADTRARVIPFPGTFNWSAINNRAAAIARGEILLFLNNDTVVLSSDWCAELAANAMRPDVGAVGARLLYADGTLQHAGVLLGVHGVAGHDCVGEPPERGGYFGRSHLQRSTSAVTGACMATRREVFERLGGFDEVELKVAFNDIDYCLRLRESGYRVVYTPFAVLYHYESKSRGHDLSEAKQARHRAETTTMRARWGLAVDTDPYYNAHFERFARPFERLRSPPAGS
jgi:GT2 family glycosyltransferase